MPALPGPPWSPLQYPLAAWRLPSRDESPPPAEAAHRHSVGDLKVATCAGHSRRGRRMTGHRAARAPRLDREPLKWPPRALWRHRGSYLVLSPRGPAGEACRVDGWRSFAHNASRIVAPPGAASCHLSHMMPSARTSAFWLVAAVVASAQAFVQDPGEKATARSAAALIVRIGRGDPCRHHRITPVQPGKRACTTR